MTDAPPTLEQIEGLLQRVHGAPVHDVEPLSGGYWSSAFGYRAGERELVLRLGKVREGFEMDRAAMAFDRPGLPVPEVLEIGDALGGSYAISVRHHGRFLETIAPGEAAAVAPAIERTLDALRSVPAEPDEPTDWFHRDGPGGATWRHWLTEGLVDDPKRRVSGWRRMLAADAGLDALFRACEARIAGLLDACPERRDLVHGDLLHQNVLLADDPARVTAVFSWKCSVRGDFLYEVACCTFWGPWHPGIAEADVWGRTLRSPTLAATDLVDAPERHHCYELQIAAHHLGWNAWTGDRDTQRDLVAHTSHVLERGPLSVS